jgi:hypothetical protein
MFLLAAFLFLSFKVFYFYKFSKIKAKKFFFNKTLTLITWMTLIITAILNISVLLSGRLSGDEIEIPKDAFLLSVLIISIVLLTSFVAIIWLFSWDFAIKITDEKVFLLDLSINLNSFLKIENKFIFTKLYYQKENILPKKGEDKSIEKSEDDKDQDQDNRNYDFEMIYFTTKQAKKFIKENIEPLILSIDKKKTK